VSGSLEKPVPGETVAGSGAGSVIEGAANPVAVMTWIYLHGSAAARQLSQRGVWPGWQSAVAVGSHSTSGTYIWSTLRARRTYSAAERTYRRQGWRALWRRMALPPAPAMLMGHDDKKIWLLAGLVLLTGSAWKILLTSFTPRRDMRRQRYKSRLRVRR